MQLSWEHLLHFSNAFVKGIIGQIASNVILGEVRPFFHIFIYYAISLNHFLGGASQVPLLPSLVKWGQLP
jgi:hypothetical protein